MTQPIQSKNNPHSLKVGDIVTGYHKGYHKIVAMDGTPGLSGKGLVTYVTLKHDKMQFGASRKNCDIAYCAPAVDDIKSKISELTAVLAFVQGVNP